MIDRKLSVCLLFAVVATGCVPLSTGLVVESVDNYSIRNGPTLGNSIANGDGFIAWMTGAPTPWLTISPSPWTLVIRYPDNLAADADFTDSELNSAGRDLWNFDRPSTAISYFTGHGDCTDGCSTQSCTNTSSCTTPVAGSRLPGTCRYSPMDAPRCCYLTDRQALTSSSFDFNAGRANYTSGPLRWGESTTSGAWAGAGTNGGTNLAVLDISCGVLPPFWSQQLVNAMAGVHMVATILVAGGDTDNVPDRGATFGAMWASNPNGSPAQAWLDTMASLPANEGNACIDRQGNNLGGGRGFNGCGCNIVVAMDATANSASDKINEDWRDLRSDDRDATGRNFYVARMQCNYPLPASGRAAWELP